MVLNKYDGKDIGCKNCLNKNTDNCFVRVTGDVKDVCPDYEFRIIEF